MITSVRLQGFKGHRDTELPLGRFTVLVGPNGAGKTSVLDALWLQSQLARLPPVQVLTGDWSPSDLQRRGGQGPIVLALGGTSSREEWTYRAEILAPPTAVVKLDWKHGDVARQVQAAYQSSFDSYVSQIPQVVGASAFYKLDAGTIAAPAYSDLPGAEIERDGTNTAVALAAIKLGYDEAFDRIEEEMRRLVPNVERVRIRQAKVALPNRGDVVGSKIFFDFRGAPGVPAHAASEGTLITLALLTILHGPNRPNLLLLDDFAQSLHPRAQTDLVHLIQRLLVDLADVQIVATTHSPAVLDEVESRDVHAFALGEDGAVVVKCLSRHPLAAKLEEDLSPGQLWSLELEKNWVLDTETPS